MNDTKAAINLHIQEYVYITEVQAGRGGSLFCCCSCCAVLMFHRTGKNMI